MLFGAGKLVDASHRVLAFIVITSQIVLLSEKLSPSVLFAVEKLPFAHAESQWKMSSHFEFARILEDSSVPHNINNFYEGEPSQASNSSSSYVYLM